MFGVWKYFLDLIFCRFSVSFTFAKRYCQKKPRNECNDSSWNAVILSAKYFMKKWVSKCEDLMEMWNVTAGTFLKEEILNFKCAKRIWSFFFFPHAGPTQFEYFAQRRGFEPSSALYDATLEETFSTLAKICWTDASGRLCKLGTDHLLD